MLRLKLIIFAVTALTLSEPVWSICDTVANMDKTIGIDIQFFGNRAQTAISNDERYKENCASYEDGVNRLTDYAKSCLQGTPGKMGQIIMKSVRQHYEKRCKDVDFGAEFVEHNKCFEDQSIFEQFHLCADRWYHQMQRLPELKLQLAQGIQSACCIIHDFQRCIRENNVNLCHDKNAKFWDDTIDETADDTKNAFCSNLKTPEECAANFPQDLWQQINGPVAQMSNDALVQKTGKFQSMLFTVLDMASQYQINP